MTENNYITGYYGCSCHPFESWEECAREHKKKLNIGDRVKSRHTGKEGYITEIIDREQNFYMASVIGFEHAASLIKIK